MLLKRKVNLKGKKLSYEDIIKLLLKYKDKENKTMLFNYILNEFEQGNLYSIEQLKKIKNSINDFDIEYDISYKYYIAIKDNIDRLYSAIESGIFNEYGYKTDIVEYLINNSPYHIIKKFYSNKNNYEYKYILVNSSNNNYLLSSILILGYNSKEDEKLLISIKDLLDTFLKTDISVLYEVNNSFVLNRLKEYEDVIISNCRLNEIIKLSYKKDIIDRKKIYKLVKESDNPSYAVLCLAYFDDFSYAYDFKYDDIIKTIDAMNVENDVKKELLLQISKKMNNKLKNEKKKLEDEIINIATEKINNACNK